MRCSRPIASVNGHIDDARGKRNRTGTQTERTSGLRSRGGQIHDGYAGYDEQWSSFSEEQRNARFAMHPTQDVWQKVRSQVGDRDNLPELRLFKPTTFLPTFLTKAVLTPVTGLRVGLEMSMEFLKAKLEIGVGLLKLSGDFGPVFWQARPFNPD